MFVPIHPRDLVKGTKYKINGYTGYYQYKIGAVTVFYNVRNHVEIEMFSMAGYTFEQFISEKPQEKMERRAVNKVLRGILGDECFEW
jgi:hypothetical protein